MSYDWGPHFIVPSENLKTFSGAVLLRESLNEDLLQKELAELGFSGAIMKISNPWYYRKKDADSWIKIGESDNRHENFPVSWNTSKLKNGEYEVLGLMHVYVEKGKEQAVIARQSVVEVTIQN